VLFVSMGSNRYFAVKYTVVSRTGFGSNICLDFR
jgi:hypothetical protein